MGHFAPPPPQIGLSQYVISTHAQLTIDLLLHLIMTYIESTCFLEPA